MTDILFGGTGPNPSGDNVSPETSALGFDEVTIATYQAPVSAGGITLMGKTLIFTVPSRVDRAELRELAVHGNPEGKFQTMCWWQIQIEEGATQELLFRSEILTTLATQLNPPRTSGFQYGRFGSLHRPQGVYALLRQGQRLVLSVFTDANVQLLNLTTYVRVRGLIYSGH